MGQEKFQPEQGAEQHRKEQLAEAVTAHESAANHPGQEEEAQKEALATAHAGGGDGDDPAPCPLLCPLLTVGTGERRRKAEAAAAESQAAALLADCEIAAGASEYHEMPDGWKLHRYADTLHISALPYCVLH